MAIIPDHEDIEHFDIGEGSTGWCGHRDFLPAYEKCVRVHVCACMHKCACVGAYMHGCAHVCVCACV